MVDRFDGAYAPAAAPVFRGNYYRSIPGAREWQGAFTEDVIDPDMPIIDAHHHLQEDRKGRYLFHEWSPTWRPDTISSPRFTCRRAR